METTKMSRQLRNLAIVIVIPLFFGCGAIVDNSKETTETPYTTGGTCDKKVSSDFNTMEINCSSNWTDEDKLDCKATAEAFLRKYPGINCHAEKQSETSIGTEVVLVTEADLQKRIDDLEKQLVGSNP
jgi:hypothetical protein